MLKAHIFKENRQIPSLFNLVGHSPVMQQVYQKIRCLAQSDTTVLIYGETGTGKELVADAIHRLSARKDAPLIKTNCATFSDQLLESELFGHVKGAFTGAIKDRIGRFEAAESGTLFLDEIGDISPAIQVSLLRVLEQKCIERIGCNITRPIDVRIITATNKDLTFEIASGRFREDLFHRLNIVTLMLPPLRERREDIPELVEYFIQCFNQTFMVKIKGISAEAMAQLIKRDWAELRNTIEHAFVYCQDHIIGIKDLGSGVIISLEPRVLERRITHFGSGERRILERRKSERRSSIPGLSTESNVVPINGIKLEADTVRHALVQHHWHIGHTATALGMHRTTLWRHMQRLGLGKS
jgi:transcriptional regulator with GAF, ATPase, and Fis domain